MHLPVDPAQTPDSAIEGCLSICSSTPSALSPRSALKKASPRHRTSTDSPTSFSSSLGRPSTASSAASEPFEGGALKFEDGKEAAAMPEEPVHVEHRVSFGDAVKCAEAVPHAPEAAASGKRSDGLSA